MEIKLAENLKLESEIPFLNVVYFQFTWGPGRHALLKLEGYVDRKIKFNLLQLYDGKIKLWFENEGKTEILYHGCILNVERKIEGDTEKVLVNAGSASCKLDQQPHSRSFQDTKKTYAEVIRQVVQEGSGEVITTVGRNEMLIKPVIQYEETDWCFIRRLAGHLGSGILPDIETGRPCLWFGIRKGRKIPSFSEEQYVETIKKEFTCEVKSKEFYKIGDQTSFLGKDIYILGMSATYEQGELIFTYLLKDRLACNIIYHDKFAGLGLRGNIQEVKGELVKINLYIDGGNSTGDYFYHWYPETGNALYAMPEPGSDALLYFGSADEREGYVLHCFPAKTKEKRDCSERCLNIADGNSIKMYENALSFSRGGSHNLSLRNGSISFGTVKKVKISAKGKIRLKAKHICLDSSDELNVSQG